MRDTSRKFAAAICLIALGGLATAAHAQSFPTRGISVVVPYGAGGQTDIASRMFSEAMSGVLGQTVTVVNRPGGGGSVGTAEIAQFEPDGYRLGMLTSTPVVRLPHLNQVPYNLDSFAYVCRVFNNPLIFAVKKDSAVNSPADLVKMAGSTTVRYGSSGPGSTQHLAMIRFSELSKVNMTHVPSSSDTDNLRNILAGVITGTLIPASVIKQNADTIKPIGVMDSARHPAYPDVPTFKEAGYDVKFAIWGGLAGPKSLPAPVLDKLRSSCQQAQSTPEFAERMRKLGMEPSYMSAADFEAAVREEYEISGRLLKSLDLPKK